MSDTTPAFVTGSHAYGTPTKDSDLDLVILVSTETADALRRLWPPPPVEYAADEYVALSVNVGKLNLLLTPTRKHYNVWRSGTETLKAMAPVTREQAVALFKKLRKEARDDDGN